MSRTWVTSDKDGALCVLLALLRGVHPVHAEVILAVISTLSFFRVLCKRTDVHVEHRRPVGSGEHPPVVGRRLICQIALVFAYYSSRNEPAKSKTTSPQFFFSIYKGKDFAFVRDWKIYLISWYTYNYNLFISELSLYLSYTQYKTLYDA